MKRITLPVASLVVSLGVALGVVGVAQANWSNNFQSSDQTVTVAAGDTHQGALYAGANSIVIAGTVKGDVYCAASELTISGVVEGDVLCAAQKVTLDDGKVNGDVRLAAQFVNLSGAVDGSVSAIAQDVRIAKGTTVEGDLNGLSQMTTVDGTVSGDVAAAGQGWTLSGTVGGNADLAYESIKLAESANIAGNLNYTASRANDIDQSRVDGVVSYNHSQPAQVIDGEKWVGGLMAAAIAMLLTALIVALVAPRFVDRSSQLLRRRGLTTVLLGFAVAFGVPLLIGMTFVTIFLIPIAIMMLLTWLLVAILSGVFFAYYIGSVLLRGVENIVLRMLGGAVALLILCMIPIVNVFVMFAAWVVGSGMIVSTLTNGYRRPDYSLAAPAKPAKKRSVAKKK